MPNKFDAEGVAVGLQRFHLGPGDGVFNVQPVFGGGDIMIHGGEGQLRTADRATGKPHAFECLGAGDFVHQMAIDIQQCRAVRQLTDDMWGPDFFEKRFSHGAASLVQDE